MIDTQYVLTETGPVFMSLLNTSQGAHLVIKTTRPLRTPPPPLLARAASADTGGHALPC